MPELAWDPEMFGETYTIYVGFEETYYICWFLKRLILYMLVFDETYTILGRGWSYVYWTSSIHS